MECERIEKVESAGMKIILDIPDTTRGLAITGIYADGTDFMMAQRNVDSGELKAGAEIMCDWEGGVSDE